MCGQYTKSLMRHPFHVKKKIKEYMKEKDLLEFPRTSTDPNHKKILNAIRRYHGGIENYAKTYCVKLPALPNDKKWKDKYYVIEQISQYLNDKQLTEFPRTSRDSEFRRIESGINRHGGSLPIVVASLGFTVALPQNYTKHSSGYITKNKNTTEKAQRKKPVKKRNKHRHNITRQQKKPIEKEQSIETKIEQIYPQINPHWNFQNQLITYMRFHQLITLDYTTLKKHGRYDLMTRIKEHGGIKHIRNYMNIPVPNTLMVKKLEKEMLSREQFIKSQDYFLKNRKAA